MGHREFPSGQRTAASGSRSRASLARPRRAALLLSLSLLIVSACSNIEPLSNDLLYGGPGHSISTTVARPQTPATPQPLVQPPTTEVLPAPTVAPPVVERGVPPVVAQSPAAAPAVQIAPGGDVTLNFAGADIRDVAHVVLGDILGLNYTVDPTVQGTVTVQTSHPLPRSAVLPTLEQVFAASGAAIIQENNLIRVVPLQGAKGTPPQGGGLSALQGATGFGVQVIPLQYASAADLQKILAPFVPQGATVQADAAHNILLVSGTQQDVQGVIELVRTFDVDWLARTSFALVPLRAVPAETIANEMTNIVAGQNPSDTTNAVRVVPIDRLNAVLVITAQPRYLDWARGWIERLDEGSEDDTQRTYVYHVQHGRAADLADVLNRVFGSGRASSGSSPSSATLTPPTPAASSGFGGGADTSAGILPSTGSISTPSGGSSSNSMLAPLTGGTSPGGTSTSTSIGAAASPGTPTDSSQGSGATNTGAVRIVTDDSDNALVIVTTPRTYRQIEEALKRLDVEPMQVVIDATIAEVTLTDQLQYGLQWFFRQHNNLFGFSSNTTLGLPPPSPVFTPDISGFSYVFSGSNMQVVLNALASLTKVDVLSAPELLVLNNQTAQLQVGASVPVPVQQAQSTLTAGAPLVNTISYLDTGVILSVTPRANANGEVTLDIEQDVSDAEATTSSTLDAPTVNQRRIKSSVDIQSGQSIALGGLISTNRSFVRSGIPVLANIPVLGALFRNDNDTKTRTELLVLIQPRVITNNADAVAATSDLINRMQYVQPFDTTKH